METINFDKDRRLDASSPSQRLTELRAMAGSLREGITSSEMVNNHVHTCFSFSPYTPSMAAAKALRAGLMAVGVVDHDTVSGCHEMIEAGRILNLATTIGCEIRVNMTGTHVEGLRTNCPDARNISYIVIHGVPHAQIDRVKAFLGPIHVWRHRRNRQQVAKLNALIHPLGIGSIDYDHDVRLISQAADGGSITERHILHALAIRILDQVGRGLGLSIFLEERVGVPVSPQQLAVLADSDNPWLDYDLVGILKDSLLPRFYIEPDTRECISVFDAVAFANEIGAIPAYAYLGDADEATDSRNYAQRFEDDYLDELIPELVRIGFKAITYMPPRNSRRQLLRLRRLCREHAMMEISGVDVNSPRQDFRCPIVLEPEFSNLIDSTWALVAHERLASFNPAYGLFSERNMFASLSLDERIVFYATLGKLFCRGNCNPLMLGSDHTTDKRTESCA